MQDVELPQRIQSEAISSKPFAVVLEQSLQNLQFACCRGIDERFGTATLRAFALKEQKHVEMASSDGAVHRSSRATFVPGCMQPLHHSKVASSRGIVHSSSRTPLFSMVMQPLYDLEVSTSSCSVPFGFLGCACTRKRFCSPVQTNFAPYKPGEQLQFVRLWVLTAKKTLYLCNVSESDAATRNVMTEAVREHVESEGSMCLTVSGSLEESAASSKDEKSQLEYLNESGLKGTGLTKVIRASQDLLHLWTYYTMGNIEARAWNVLGGSTAAVATSVIRSVFERPLIRAETVGYEC
ncbi:hypothetical protein BBJ28_00007804 [Nothophytophthora sp. Chile5]|nr:hypothetical protein BBJ28_00007804 [Nothophytophthora sp. Chile5]